MQSACGQRANLPSALRRPKQFPSELIPRAPWPPVAFGEYFDVYSMFLKFSKCTLRVFLSFYFTSLHLQNHVKYYRNRFVILFHHRYTLDDFPIFPPSNFFSSRTITPARLQQGCNCLPGPRALIRRPGLCPGFSVSLPTIPIFFKTP